MKQKNSQYEYYFRITVDSKYGGQKVQEACRDIVIKENQTLSTLARAITGAFGFYFDHCYGFYDNFENHYESKEVYELFTDIPEDPNPGALGVTYVKVSAAFSRIGKKLRFLFDYGDSWWFTVELININPINRRIKYPKLLKSVGSPPEQYPALEEDFLEKDLEEDLGEGTIMKFQLARSKAKRTIN